MGSCMSSLSTSRARRARSLDPGARSSRRWQRSGGGDRRGLLGKWVGQAKALSRRGLGENLPGGAVGRMVLGGSSGAACLFTQQGRKGPNQDAMVVWENFTSREDTVFCGVFDGHGPFGHMVAKKVRDTLPVKLCSQWKAVSDCNSTGGNVSCEENAPVNAEDEWVESQESGSEYEKFPEVYGTLRQSLLKAFKLMDKELKLHPAIDCFCSGSTAVTLVKQGRDIIIGNIGDSRAVLGTRDMNNNMIAVQLTVDLKPNLPREAARIQRCKGRVFALQDEPEVPRVWLPNSDSPGLAMARAFGDFCLKDYGLISVPDISYRHLTDQDEFIVMATDGVWDVLSNKEVVDIVSTAPTRSSAARMLVECATSEWQIKFPTSKIDDCAVICLFLNRPSASSRVQETVSPQLSTHCAEPTASGSAYEGTTSAQASLDGFELHGNALQEMFPLVGIDEILIEGSKDSMPIESVESMRLPDPTSEEEWTALDGVTRVNTLLNLPRFRSDDGRMAGQKD